MPHFSEGITTGRIADSGEPTRRTGTPSDGEADPRLPTRSRSKDDGFTALAEKPTRDMGNSDVERVDPLLPNRKTEQFRPPDRIGTRISADPPPEPSSVRISNEPSTNDDWAWPEARRQSHNATEQQTSPTATEQAEIQHGPVYAAPPTSAVPGALPPPDRRMQLTDEERAIARAVMGISDPVEAERRYLANKLALMLDGRL